MDHSERVAAIDLAAELRTSPPELAVWTWHPTDHSAAFVARRSATS